MIAARIIVGVWRDGVQPGTAPPLQQHPLQIGELAFLPLPGMPIRVDARAFQVVQIGLEIDRGVQTAVVLVVQVGGPPVLVTTARLP